LKSNLDPQSLSNFLRENSENFLILRNPDISASLLRGGDVDCLVRDINLACTAIQSALGPPFLRISRFYVTQLFYPWGHIDLSTQVTWKSLRYLESDELWHHSRILPNGLRVLSQSHEAVINWLSSLIWGGFTKERYMSMIQDYSLKEKGAFRSVLEKVFDPTTSDQLTSIAQASRWNDAERMVPHLRWLLISKAILTHPRRSISSTLRYFASEITLRISPPFPTIAFLGPDGAGKSTVISHLSKKLAPCCSGIELKHWRPAILPDFGVLIRKRPASSSINIDPHGLPPHGFFSSFLRLLYYMTDYWVGFVLLLNARARGRIIIYDRYADDMLVDPRRFRFGLPNLLLKLCRFMTPDCNLTFCLTAPVEVLRFRKDEVSESETLRQVTEYATLTSRKANGHIIETERPIDAITTDIQERIFKYIHTHQ